MKPIGRYKVIQTFGTGVLAKEITWFGTLPGGTNGLSLLDMLYLQLCLFSFLCHRISELSLFHLGQEVNFFLLPF